MLDFTVIHHYYGATTIEFLLSGGLSPLLFSGLPFAFRFTVCVRGSSERTIS